MGFGFKWLKWMESCVFSSYTSILINGNLTKDFKLEKGLRQGDPLSPFLFVLVTEALAGLMRKAEEQGIYRGFKCNGVEDVSLVQFTDDTVLIADGKSDNFWAMKVVLRGFQLMTGLTINFLKSKLYGSNVCEWLMEAGSDFLNCDRDAYPFKYLGVKVGDSPRKVSMWRDLIEQLKKRLATWKGMHLNMVGRVTMINVILNAIPIFSLSFYRAPDSVIKEIRKIQSNFLWHNSEGSRTIHVVSWNSVCNPKDKGGLAELREWLEGSSLNRDEADIHEWRLTEDGIFSVKSCYVLLFKGLMRAPTCQGDTARAVESLWKVEAPAKLKFFGWRVLINRIASKDNLIKRNINVVSQDPSCIFCHFALENIDHLFASFPFADSLWKKISVWLDVDEFVSVEELKHVFLYSDKIMNRMKRKIVEVVWLEAIWSIWLVRNDSVFNQANPSFVECLSAIIFRPWIWLPSCSKLSLGCNFATWNTHPFLCFGS
ncbi:uncharacterized protein LOC131643311 [Vicia villosa]|uniref:uncharacterized protein LOC131643311 n=1 Tax=Vicia villosa TaxID=3911 RepID=UPI00273B5129|nr:uncharacterized protein LOC131643311 [Vicia villosa]